MIQAEREKIIERIRKLMAVTTAAGAAEAEAMKAAAAAADLMDKHGISFAEVQKQTNTGFVWRKLTPKQRWLAEFQAWIASAIAAYTGTVSTAEHQLTMNGKRGKIYGVGFAGETSDVLFAEWLVKAVGDFVHAGYLSELHRVNDRPIDVDPRAWQKRKLVGKELAKFRSGYLLGAAWTIISRLNAMTKERVDNQITANALTIISKSELALHNLEQQQGEMGSVEQRSVEYDKGAVAAGIRRGQQAQFNRAVEHQDSVLLMIEKG